MKREVHLSQLRDVTVLFRNDLYLLARFLLKSRVACDRECRAVSPYTIRKSRLSLYGLAASYAKIAELRSDRVEKALVDAGLDLRATVEFDLRKKK